MNATETATKQHPRSAQDRCHLCDILDRADATGRDAVDMGTGAHYNYRAQRWVTGHDHAHFCGDDSPLVYCGADYFTCQGEEQAR